MQASMAKIFSHVTRSGLDVYGLEQHRLAVIGQVLKKRASERNMCIHVHLLFWGKPELRLLELRLLMYLRPDLFQRRRPAAMNLVRRVILTVGEPFPGLMPRQSVSAASVERVAGT